LRVKEALPWQEQETGTKEPSYSFSKVGAILQLSAKKPKRFTKKVLGGGKIGKGD